MYNYLYVQLARFNADFRVKQTSAADTRGRLIGLKGFVDAVGDIDLATRIYLKARASKGDKFTAKLRRGIRFTFYAR